MSDDVLAAMVQTANEELAELTRRLFAGQINITQWAIGTAGTLKDAHLANALQGAGSDVLNLGQLGRVGINLADEMKHLFDFAVGIVRGDVSEAQAMARIEQYGKASEQAYNREWLVQNRRPEWDDLPRLNQVPRDGKTECHGHCNCTLRKAADGIHWDVNPGENCNGCLSLAAGGPYQPGRV